MSDDLNTFLASTAFTLLGVLFFRALYVEAKRETDEWNKGPFHKKGIGDSFIWVFACYPGALVLLGPVGMVWSGLRLIYP